MIILPLFAVNCLLQLSSAIDRDECLDKYSYTREDSMIIRARESLSRNASLIYKKDFISGVDECHSMCCGEENCNTAIIRTKIYYDEITEDYKEKIGCFLFDCKSPSVCTFQEQEGFTAIKLERNLVIKTTETTTTALPKDNRECPPGAPVAMCADIPCKTAQCPGEPSAVCRNSFCGGCHAVFYMENGEKADCSPKLAAINHAAPSDVAVADNDKEEEVTVASTDEQEAPHEQLPGQVDEYYQSEKRRWPEGSKVHILSESPPVTDEALETTPFVIVDKVKVVNNTLVSIPLLVALIITLMLLLGLVYRVMCAKRGKPKKLAVDDGDYLINGMYL